MILWPTATHTAEENMLWKFATAIEIQRRTYSCSLSGAGGGALRLRQKRFLGTCTWCPSSLCTLHTAYNAPWWLACPRC